MSHLEDLLAANDAKPEQEYAVPSTCRATIQEIKHGINQKTKMKFDAIVYTVNEVLDQKLPRPEGERRGGGPLFSQDPVEVGAQQCIYIDHRYESNMNEMTDMIAVIAAASVDKAIKGRSALTKEGNEDVLQAFKDSFPKNAKDDAYKTAFQGVVVDVDVSPKYKNGLPTGYSTYAMSAVL